MDKQQVGTLVETLAHNLLSTLSWELFAHEHYVTCVSEEYGGGSVLSEATYHEGELGYCVLNNIFLTLRDTAIDTRSYPFEIS